MTKPRCADPIFGCPSIAPSPSLHLGHLPLRSPSTTIFQAGLDLEKKAFDSLDTDGQGYLDGHMDLNVESVAC